MNVIPNAGRNISIFIKKLSLEIFTDRPVIKIKYVKMSGTSLYLFESWREIFPMMKELRPVVKQLVSLNLEIS